MRIAYIWMFMFQVRELFVIYSNCANENNYTISFQLKAGGALKKTCIIYIHGAGQVAKRNYN